MQNDEVEIIFDDSGWSTVNERGTYHYKYDDIYKIENTKNFFLGKNKTLYLIYAYGNKNYTSEMDIVVM